MSEAADNRGLLTGLQDGLQQSILAETVVVAAVILNDRQERWRGSVSLAVQRVVAGDSVAPDEQDCEALRPMILTAALPVQCDKPSKRLHETVPETSGGPAPSSETCDVYPLGRKTSPDTDS